MLVVLALLPGGMLSDLLACALHNSPGGLSGCLLLVLLLLLPKLRHLACQSTGSWAGTRKTASQSAACRHATWQQQQQQRAGQLILHDIKVSCHRWLYCFTDPRTASATIVVAATTHSLGLLCVEALECCPGVPARAALKVQPSLVGPHGALAAVVARGGLLGQAIQPAAAAEQRHRQHNRRQQSCQTQLHDMQSLLKRLLDRLAMTRLAEPAHSTQHLHFEVPSQLASLTCRSRPA